MDKAIIESKDKIIEKKSLKSFVDTTIDKIIVTGSKIEGFENGFDSYGFLYLKSLKETNKSIIINISCDRLDLSHDIIIFEIDKVDYNNVKIDYPTVEYKLEIPFVISRIDVYGQKGLFHFEGKQVHPLWFRGGESVPHILDYFVDSENALMLISTDGRRIFIAHDTAPRFEIATSEAHINFILSHKYGFEEGFFQLQRTVCK